MLSLFLDSDGDDSDSSDSEEKASADEVNPEIKRLENLKNFFLSKVNPNEYVTKKTFLTDVQHTYIDYESAELVTHYLASKRPFSKSFEAYLKHVSVFFQYYIH